MSRIFPRTISLAEVLQSSSTMVLLVSKLDPFWTTNTVSISSEKKSCPDFTYWLSHCQIKKVIHNKSSWELKENEIIEVRSADFSSKLKNHKEYYLIGLSKSTYSYSYENSFDIEAATEAIIFVQPDWELNVLEYCVGGAFHDPADLQPILDVLANSQ